MVSRESVLNMTPTQLAELAKQIEEAKAAHERQELELRMKITERAVEMLNDRNSRFVVAQRVTNEQGQSSLVPASFDDVFELARREHDEAVEQARLKRKEAGRKAAATRKENSHTNG